MVEVVMNSMEVYLIIIDFGKIFCLFCLFLEKL